MNQRTRQVSYFLSSQYFSHGLRTTLSILLPSVLLAQVGQLPAGLAMSIGALSVSLTDAPGPVQHRRNGMAATVLAGGVVTLVTGFARMNDYSMGLEILGFGFLFSMLAVYGNRATSVGTAALLIVILMLDRPLDAVGVVRESGLIMAGGTWYTVVSLLASQLQPYRSAQQALGLCIHEIAKFMTIKANFYNTSTDLDDDYRRLVAQQVVVSEKQNEVRELLFKSRQFVAESTNASRVLVLTFVDVLDLYEQVVSLYYDYGAIRERFGHSDVLDIIARLIRRLATELDRIGLTVQTTVPPRQPTDFTPALDHLKRSIDTLGGQEGNPFVLKKILVNLRNVSQRLATIQANLASPDENRIAPDGLELGRFVSHQEIDLKSFRENLTLDSSVFRHSVRVALALLVGFVVTKIIPHGPHSYWVLLTISVILKPAFSLTRQRNTERIIGTVAGGLAGVAILTFIPDKTVQFGLMVLLMIGTYSAQRANYIVMVICLTPFILILGNLLGKSYFGAAEERLTDTLIGGVIALAAGYLIFPRWESEQLDKPMQGILKANIRYLQLLFDSLSGQQINTVEYRLARKDVYVTSANLAAAFERMVSEPKHKQRNERLIYKFVVLNHILSANVAAILSARLAGQPKPVAITRPIKRALFALTNSLNQLADLPQKPPAETTLPNPAPAITTPDDRLLVEQLNFIQQVSGDLNKLVERVK